MTNYIIRRLFQAVFLLFVLSMVMFALVNLAPGGPLAGHGQTRTVNPERIAILKRQFGLDKPLPTQYLIWLVGNDWMQVDKNGDGIPDELGIRKGVIRGDFGFSYRTRKPVLEEISARLPNTIYLMGVMLIVSLLIAIPVGVVSAVKQYSPLDITLTTISFAGQAIPEFWLGLLLILIFYVWLENPVTGGPLLPAGGMYTIGAEFKILDRIAHLIMPVTAGALGWIAWYSRFLRSNMLDVIHQDYIRTARAKGVSHRMVIYKHALRNALIPLVTMLALDLPYVVTGAVFIETIFSWPGMGRLFYQSALQRDYPMLMAILIISGVLMIFSNLIADLGYSALDPRIRYD